MVWIGGLAIETCWQGCEQYVRVNKIGARSTSNLGEIGTYPLTTNQLSGEPKRISWSEKMKNHPSPFGFVLGKSTIMACPSWLRATILPVKQKWDFHPKYDCFRFKDPSLVSQKVVITPKNNCSPIYVWLIRVCPRVHCCVPLPNLIVYSQYTPKGWNRWCPVNFA